MIAQSIWQYQSISQKTIYHNQTQYLRYYTAQKACFPAQHSLSDADRISSPWICDEVIANRTLSIQKMCLMTVLQHYGKSLHDGNDIDQTRYSIITSRYEILWETVLLGTRFIQLIPNNNPFLFDEDNRAMSISTMIVCPYDIGYELTDLPTDIEIQQNRMTKIVRLIYKIIEKNIQNTAQKRLRKERTEMQHFPHPHYHFCLSELPLSQAIRGDRWWPLSVGDIRDNFKSQGFFEARERIKEENTQLWQELQEWDTILMEKYVYKTT